MLNYVRKKIYKYIEDLNLDKNKIKIQLGYSGGLDSSCLLDVLLNLQSELNIEIFLSYVNYNTSSYSANVLTYVKSLPNSINKNVKDIKISINNNFESKARLVRYEFFNKIDKKHDIDLTFTAHHQADQLETLIMHFINESDFISMIGIREEMGKIKRPILKYNKYSILEYSKKNNVVFFNDPTNNDYSFNRNKVRKFILPFISKDNFLLNKIKDLNNSSIQKFNQLKKKINIDVKKTIVANADFYLIINYDIIISYDYIGIKLFFQTMLKRFFNINNYTANKSFWIEVKDFIDSSRIGSVFKLSDSYYLLKERNAIVIYNNIKIKNINNKRIRVLSKNNWGFGKISIADTLNRGIKNQFECFINRSVYDKGIYLRSWKYGDKVHLTNGKHKKVSDIFIDGKIPLFKKKLYPVLEDSNGNIIWIPGLFSNNRLLLASEKILIKWEE